MFQVEGEPNGERKMINGATFSVPQILIYDINNMKREIRIPLPAIHQQQKRKKNLDLRKLNPKEQQTAINIFSYCEPLQNHLAVLRSFFAV